MKEFKYISYYTKGFDAETILRQLYHDFRKNEIHEARNRLNDYIHAKQGELEVQNAIDTYKKYLEETKNEST